MQLSDNYNATRDQYMYEKAEWFLQHGDNAVLFINGIMVISGKLLLRDIPVWENCSQKISAMGTIRSERMLLLKNTAQRVLATFCNPLLSAGVIGNLSTLLPLPQLYPKKIVLPP